MRSLYARMTIGALAISIALGGCTGADPNRDDSADDNCSLRQDACVNKCYEADMGLGCTSCCRSNYLSCKVGGNYNFYGCPDKSGE